MSRFVLKKSFEPLQYLAVLCAMAGIAVCMLQKQSDAEQTQNHCDGDSCIDDWAPYIAASLMSAFCSATNSVLGEFLLSKDKKNPILAVCEVCLLSLWVSCVCGCVLCVWMCLCVWVSCVWVCLVWGVGWGTLHRTTGTAQLAPHSCTAQLKRVRRLCRGGGAGLLLQLVRAVLHAAALHARRRAAAGRRRLVGRRPRQVQ